MNNKNKLISILSVFFILSILQGQYSVENAFPNLLFTDPVGIYHAGDGTDRLFVLEQPGTIKVFSNDPSINNANTFLDITSTVSAIIKDE